MFILGERKIRDFKAKLAKSHQIKTFLRHYNHLLAIKLFNGIDVMVKKPEKYILVRIVVKGQDKLQKFAFHEKIKKSKNP